MYSERPMGVAKRSSSIHSGCPTAWHSACHSALLFVAIVMKPSAVS